MHRLNRLSSMALLALCALARPTRSTAAASLLEAGWSDDFTATDAWTAQVSWLSNPCPEANVRVADGVACFSVVNAGHGMKWRRPVKDLWVGEDRFLAIRYKAEGIRTGSDDYFVYIDDGGGGETRPIRLCDMVCDGEWHTAAVDLLDVADSDTVSAFALQVQASPDAEGGARLWIDWLRLMNRMPKGGEEVWRREHALTAEPWWADLDSARWQAEPTWLSNPGSTREVTRTGEFTTFSVAEAGGGMKWSWFLDEPLAWQGYRYMALEYRATNTVPRSDYAVCVLGQGSLDGRSYTSVISQAQLRHDGRWHTLTVSIREPVAKFEGIKGLAVQVQTGPKGNAGLSVRRLGLVNAVLAESDAGILRCETATDREGLEPLALGASATTELAEVLEAMNLRSWPGGTRVAVDEIPFVLPAAGQKVPATGLTARDQLELPVDRACSQVFLLLFAFLRGREEQVFSRDARLSAVREVDRFLVRLDYADGTFEESFPYNVTTHGYEVIDGSQVLCVFSAPGKRLRSLTLLDRMDRGAFVIVAATCRTDAKRLVPEPAEQHASFRPAARRAPPENRRSFVEQAQTLLRAGSRLFAAEFALLPLPRFFRLVNAFADDELFKRGPGGPLYDVTVDGEAVPPEQFELSACERQSETSVRLVYDRSVRPRVRLRIQVDIRPSGELALGAAVENASERPLTVGLVGPTVGPFLPGEDLVNSHYLYPMQGCAYHNRNVSLRRRYGGLFPLQFMVVCNPVAGSGLYVRTEDLSGVMRDYILRKEASGNWLSLDYPERSVLPGTALAATTTLIGVCSGDWHDAFRAYTDWVASWYTPLAPRKQWFRDVFNFRQRFLHGHDPLYDRQRGVYRLTDALAEAEEHFGGMEYLHLFDWGACGRYGRIYGRTGDYSPYDFLEGGQAAFRAAIRSVQGMGVPVGLYIEGYLLQEKGKLGRAHGAEWQLVNRRGDGVYWPNSTEMMVCPWGEAWRRVQASTYAAKVAELDVDGMYLDQFGFANSGKDCWSEAHGHPVPGYAVLGERVLSTDVRRQMQDTKRDVALYGEEAPCDVNSQVQDGSFTYHMRSCRQSRPWAPVHMLRFAIPSFKTFEILVCDRPVGCWAEGVKWVFFNGEGIWLEGPATEWFEPHTLTAIRKCHGILREHRDAFASNRPVPLVPTESAGVYANLFPGERKDVYTLYNSTWRTVDGVVLSVEHRPNARYVDAWAGREAHTERRNGSDLIAAAIGPRDVGCIVCTW